jgi:hypothetical protein
MAKKIKKIEDLSFDSRNINLGSEKGNALLHKSLQEVGAGRSVLADKNGVLIAGNKTIEAAGQVGITKIKVVETKGDEIIVVQRTDLDINSETGTKMKILDNTVSKHNYVEDCEVVEIICEEYEISAAEYGLRMKEEAGDGEEPSGYDQQKQWFLNIRIENEEECQRLYEEFIGRGMDVKIVT